VPQSWLRLQRLEVSDREDAFAAAIRCTADPANADKRTRSKWSRVMRYAAAYKPDSEPLDRFIMGKGGINACAGRFSRRGFVQNRRLKGRSAWQQVRRNRHQVGGAGWPLHVGYSPKSGYDAALR
jgi:hypothetical protein